METTASLRGVRLSAQKGRLVADQIRGLPVDRALNVLTFSPQKAAGIIRKVLESAIANAEHNDGADVDELKVRRIFVERGTFLRRFRASAKGRASKIMKPTCHIFVTVGDRLSVLKNWSSRWYANTRNFPAMLNEDIKVRDFLKKRLGHAAVSRIIIERPAKNARITIHSARPGVVIGKKGEDIESLRGELQRLMG